MCRVRSLESAARVARIRQEEREEGRVPGGILLSPWILNPATMLEHPRAQPEAPYRATRTECFSEPPRQAAHFQRKIFNATTNGTTSHTASTPISGATAAIDSPSSIDFRSASFSAVRGNARRTGWMNSGKRS